MRYVAVGDSFTEGVGDVLPDGSLRGWADLVATGLAGATGRVVHYANLAVRGRLLAPIVDEQVDAALTLDPPPTLMTFNGGGNDLMRPRPDLQRMVALTAQVVRRCRDAGVHLVLLAGPNPSGQLPLGRVMDRRGGALTGAVAALAAREGVTYVDVFDDLEVRRPCYWSADRLHLNADGHRRVAGLVLAALGHTGQAHVVDPAPPARRRPAEELRYYRQHVLPWVGRRVTGRSSGDGLIGKYRDWVPVTP